MSPTASEHHAPPPSAAPPWTWSQLAVPGFTLAYLIPFGSICLRGRNREFLLYLAVMLGLIPLAAWLHSRIGLHLGTLWGLSFWGLAHLAGGLVPIPDHWPHDDPLVLYDMWIIPEWRRYRRCADRGD